MKSEMESMKRVAQVECSLKEGHTQMKTRRKK